MPALRARRARSAADTLCSASTCCTSRLKREFSVMSDWWNPSVHASNPVVAQGMVVAAKQQGGGGGGVSVMSDWWNPSVHASNPVVAQGMVVAAKQQGGGWGGGGAC